MFSCGFQPYNFSNCCYNCINFQTLQYLIFHVFTKLKENTKFSSANECDLVISGIWMLFSIHLPRVIYLVVCVYFSGKMTIVYNSNNGCKCHFMMFSLNCWICSFARNFHLVIAINVVYTFVCMYRILLSSPNKLTAVEWMSCKTNSLWFETIYTISPGRHVQWVTPWYANNAPMYCWNSIEAFISGEQFGK